MHPGLLDVLHHGCNKGLRAVAKRIDVDLDRPLEEPVDENATLARGRRSDLLRAVADPHVAPAEDVGRTDEDRVPDLLRDLDRVRLTRSGSPGRDVDSELAAEGGKALAVLGEVDRAERRSEDRVAGVLERSCELQRCLPAELDDDAERPLARADLEHLLLAERFEVEAVGRVVVRRDGLRVAVDHDRLVAERRGRSWPRGRSSSRTRSPARCGSGPSPG